LKIVYIYRRFYPGRHSIEGLYQSITPKIAEKHTVISYYIGPWWKILIDLFQLWRYRADVYHITGDINYLTIFLPWNKSVLTIHDLFYYECIITGIKRKIYYIFWIKLPIFFAKSIIVISRHTEFKLQSLAICSRDKIFRIDNCYNPIFSFCEVAFNKVYPNILHIGSAPNKNLSRLIDAVHNIPCTLTLIGDFPIKIKLEMSKKGINFNCLHSLSAKEVLNCYKKCDLVAFISTYEGFGLPIIEAQACGKPVLTSNIPPMNCVAGDGACLVSPYSINEIRTGLLKIIEDDGYRNHIISMGYLNANRYNVNKISNDYLNFYNEFIN
jgi:glycosyltransferase involved in cell wall biosynthesis